MNKLNEDLQRANRDVTQARQQVQLTRVLMEEAQRNEVGWPLEGVVIFFWGGTWVNTQLLNHGQMKDKNNLIDSLKLAVEELKADSSKTTGLLKMVPDSDTTQENGAVVVFLSFFLSLSLSLSLFSLLSLSAFSLFLCFLSLSPLSLSLSLSLSLFSLLSLCFLSFSLSLSLSLSPLLYFQNFIIPASSPCSM